MTTSSKRYGILKLHSQMETGSEYWINFFKESSLTIEQCAENPFLLPRMSADDFRDKPLEYFISKKVLNSNQFLVTGETSGFSGKPVLTAFTEEEFRTGFVTSFVKVAEKVGFPLKANWLWAGPTGPHIVGKAVREILREVGGLDPMAIDFDPRWYRKLPENSMSRERYFAHLIEQIVTLFESQKIEVLFTTPPVIDRLKDILDQDVKDKIIGIHYAGVATGPEQYREFKEAFPNSRHLNGYGNSLFAVFPETGFSDKGIVYSNECLERVDLQVINKTDSGLREVENGEEGTVMLSRFDESILLTNMIERDVAVKTETGICNPGPKVTDRKRKVLY